MVCKECIDIFGDYLDETLDPRVMAELDEHFKDCPPCVAFFNTYKESTRMCKDTLADISIPDTICNHIRSHVIEAMKKC